MDNICAYTAATGQGYPPYVSINRLDNGDVRVSVRGDPEVVNADQSYLVEGPYAQVEIPAAEWDRMMQSAR